MPAWSDLAWDAANAATPPNHLGRIRDFLRSNPPSEGRKIAVLLQRIWDFEPQLQSRDFLVEGIFEWLAHPDNDIRSRKREVTWLNVFRGSMKEMEEDRDWTTPTDLECAWATLKIWEKGKEELYHSGAIHACAQFGHDKLLHEVLGELNRNTLGQDLETEIIFSIPDGSNDTPLGVAIRNLHHKCVQALLSRTPDEYFEMHLDKEKNILGNEIEYESLLHQCLVWADANPGNYQVKDVEEQVEFLERVTSVAKTIIQFSKESLPVRNARGEPPYYVAKAFLGRCRSKFPGQTFTHDSLALSIREECIAEFKNDPEGLIQALYCKNGK